MSDRAANDTAARKLGSLGAFNHAMRPGGQLAQIGASVSI
jgi:hypothetical protein